LLVGWLASWLGWRGAFFVAGGIGFVWLAVWLAMFRRPEEARFIGADERARVIAERDAATADLAGPSSPSGLLVLLQSRTMWGLALTQGCAVYTQYLLLTWLPSYLQATHDLSILRTGLFTSVPYFGAVILSIAVGTVSDRLLRHFGGVGAGARRTMVIISLLIAASILAVPLASGIWMILTLLTLSLTGVASAVSLNIALTNDLLTRPGDAGKAMGILVSGGNAFGLMAPIVTGYVIAATTTYSAAFLIAGFFLVAGATISLTLTREPIDGQRVSLPQPA
jgi:ACS family glucarate transporter-like MFS transporter